MASTKPVKADYSSLLDSMTESIRQHLQDGKEQDEARTHAALDIFLLNNSPQFKEEFLNRCGIDPYSSRELPPINRDEVAGFVDKIAALDGECIFLLKDCWSLMSDYQRKTGKGYGALINRGFLCKDEDNYFLLIDLVYKALTASSTLEELLKAYVEQVKRLVQESEHWRDRSFQIYDYVVSHSGRNKVVWVDIGFQFTFTLFAFASVEIHSKGTIPQDFFNFTAYPWLVERFRGKYFTERCAAALSLEFEGIEGYRESTKDRIAGAMVGFAIGDALGAPAAGIDKKDLDGMVILPIEGFTQNQGHPYFGHLSPGQYTDNTNTLILSAEELIRDGQFEIKNYVKDLVSWYGDLTIHRVSERWAGPTAVEAIEKLSQGTVYEHSGSTTTESCSSTYRTVPLGLYFRPFLRLDSFKLAEYARISGGITHNSDISLSGAILVALILADLASGVLPETAVRAAIQNVGISQGNTLLINNLFEAIERAKRGDNETGVRKRFGTGSPIYQTLPMAVFCFLKYQNDFRSAVLAAANSFRDDTPEEQGRIKDLSWEEQLIEAKGGNCDGIAALTGAFSGAHLGSQRIPDDFMMVENRDQLETLGIKLI